MSPAGIERALPLGFFAFALGSLCWLGGLPLSALMLIGFMAMTGSFADWKTEPGLWMLSGIFLVVLGGFYSAIAYFQIIDGLAGRALPGLIAKLDWIFGTAILAYLLRLLGAIAYWNFCLSMEINTADD